MKKMVPSRFPEVLPQSKDARGALMLEETLACVACGGMLLFTVIPASYDR